MFRYVNVLTLNNMDDLARLSLIFKEMKAMLPEGASMHISTDTTKDLPEMIPFGDVVQTIDFQTFAQADGFNETETGKWFRRETRGMFSSVYNVWYPV